MQVLALLLAESMASLSEGGAKAMREQRFADAEQAYRLLVQREPANPMWRMNLGLALHSRGMYSEALREFEFFLKVKPVPGPIHFMAGLARLKLGQACEAIAPLEKARAWNAEKSLVELADAYGGCARNEMAARTYEAALAAKAGDKQLARQAAHYYWLARLYPEAKRLMDSIAKGWDSDPEFNYEYGDTLVRSVGPEEGLPHLLKAVEAAPDRLAARAEAGKALLAIGRAEDAIPHLEAAAPLDASLLLPLSRAYRTVGRTADADRTQAEYRRKFSTSSQ